MWAPLQTGCFPPFKYLFPYLSTSNYILASESGQNYFDFLYFTWKPLKVVNYFKPVLFRIPPVWNFFWRSCQKLLWSSSRREESYYIVMFQDGGFCEGQVHSFKLFTLVSLGQILAFIAAHTKSESVTLNPHVSGYLRGYFHPKTSVERTVINTCVAFTERKWNTQSCAFKLNACGRWLTGFGSQHAKCHFI